MFTSFALLALAAHSVFAWPDTPFSTSGRNIYDECGNEVLFAGVNWPGHLEAMIPEGLQYSSIADIVSKIRSLDLNVIRLTYAIQMIDDHLDGNPNSGLNASLYNALGEGSAPGVLQQILTHNPQFTADTTRLEIFDAVAEECAKQELWIHLDNHQSKAYWCCPQWDGNAWFNDTSFSVYNWTRGLGFMADRAKNWDALVSMSLRNELRPPASSQTALPYNWKTWVDNVIPAATAIHGNNSSPLIFFSGLNWDTNLDLLITGSDSSSNATFTPSDYPFEDKMVYEVHNYANSASCDVIAPGLYSGAYAAMNLSDPNVMNHAPVVLSEFGFDQTDGSDQGAYAQCLKNALVNAPGGPGGWMYWDIVGSYYTRIGAIDSDETWGEFPAASDENILTLR